MFLAPPGAPAGERPLVLGVFPRHSPAETVQMFTPLANHLSRELGRPVQVRTTTDFKTFWDAIAAGRYDLVHCNQYHYLRAHQELGYRVIAKNEEIGRAAMAGAIVVRRDSGIRSLADLRGKTIVFGGNRQALMSYIIPTQMLRRAGLAPGSYTEVFASDPPNVPLAVYFRRADAGGTGDVVLDMPFVRDKIDTSKLMYLARSEEVSQLPWAVSPRMPAAEAERIRRALLAVRGARDGPDILATALLTNLLPATDREYDSIRRIVRTVTGERY